MSDEPVKQIDLAAPGRNMFGVLPCPKCKAEYRWPGTDGLIHCDDCGATEPIHESVQMTALVMTAAGNPCGTVAIDPEHPPASVAIDGVLCPLWTTRDQQGQVVYLKPDPTLEAPDGV